YRAMKPLGWSAAGGVHVGADRRGPAGAFLDMNLEKFAPAAQQVDRLIAGGMRINQAASDVVVQIDCTAILHAAHADHAFVQISLALEDDLAAGRLIGVNQAGAVDLVPVAELASDMHADPAVTRGVLQRRDGSSSRSCPYVGALGVGVGNVDVHIAG